MQHQQYLRRRAAIFSLTATMSLASAWAGSQNDNLPNFQKVNDRVYRGAQPTDSGFQQLAQLGIKTVVDLREIGEHSQADEQKIVTDLGMRYVSIPMHGMSTPKDDQVAAVQALFNDPVSGPVFVHCKRGADRTGMVIAVYRVSHDGWDNKKALSEAKSNGMSMFERAIQHYVMDYKPAVTLAAAGAGADSASSIADTRAVR
jgi:tyrosine-protein phosphatase SIW14